jgi:hypothetical protein
MVWTFKLRFDEDILAFFGLATVLAKLSTSWAFFPNLLGQMLKNLFIR